jgi:hypothetical protein
MAKVMAADPTLFGLLQDAAGCPDDPLPLLALADYLTEAGPGPVRLGEVPNWLRLAWLRARRGDADRRWRGLTSGWGVLMDVDEWLGRQSGTHYWRLDHHGGTTVGGLACFASEPYADLGAAREQARCLAAKAGCVGVGLPQGQWHRGTVRVLLLPVPKGVRVD